MIFQRRKKPTSTEPTTTTRFYRSNARFKGLKILSCDHWFVIKCLWFQIFFYFILSLIVSEISANLCFDKFWIFEIWFLFWNSLFVRSISNRIRIVVFYPSSDKCHVFFSPQCHSINTRYIPYMWIKSRGYHLVIKQVFIPF